MHNPYLEHLLRLRDLIRQSAHILRAWDSERADERIVRRVIQDGI